MVGRVVGDRSCLFVAAQCGSTMWPHNKNLRLSAGSCPEPAIQKYVSCTKARPLRSVTDLK